MSDGMPEADEKYSRNMASYMLGLSEKPNLRGSKSALAHGAARDLWRWRLVSQDGMDNTGVDNAVLYTQPTCGTSTPH